MSFPKKFMLVISFMLLPATACRDAAGPISGDFGEECRETSDPVSFGCVDIEGRVSNAQGQPIEGADVGPATIGTVSGIRYDFVFTDSDGGYQLRLLRIDNSAPTTFVLRMKATSRNPTGAEIASHLVDANITVTPVGSIPEAVTANFVIQ